ncbi:HD domain-containing protein [Lentibacillus lipolyticus]|nr:HD domain-containing protein [Lentibacillus lipolyticus]
MRVEPSQLVPGCVLLEDVVGKTNKAIIPKQTVLTDEHMTILHKFFVDTVEVAPSLANGVPFHPGEPRKFEQVTFSDQLHDRRLSDALVSHYKAAVEQYKCLFQNWQRTSVLNISDVRTALMPLLERVQEAGDGVYALHRYANQKDYQSHHSVSVGMLAAYVARQLGYEKGEWLQAGLAGFLSDAGMARITASMPPNKKALSATEWEELRKHPVYSYRLIEKSPAVTKSVKLAVLQHHERLDGSGYPLGVTREKIHAFARIIAVCDAYHAMTCERPHKQKQTPFQAVRALQKDMYTKLDHQAVQLLTDRILPLL